MIDPQRDTGAASDSSASGPDSMRASALSIRLLGGFIVSIGPRVLPDTAWGSRKARHLVKLLALAPGQQMLREQLLDALWPDLAPDAAVHAFYQALLLARRALDPGRTGLLPLRRQVLALRPGGGLWIDVVAFEAAATGAQRARAPAALEAALALYSGALLPDDRYEDWAIARGESLRATALALLWALAQLHERQAAWVAGIAALERLIVLDPADEAAYVGLMRLQALAGERDQALRQYPRLRSALRRHLDTEPDPAAQRLYHAILAEHFPPTPPPARLTAAAAAPPPARPGRHNLPVPLTSFVGRATAVAAVKAALTAARLVTLAGPGGGGKTRLALAVAHDLAAAYADGAWLVDLTALTDGALLAARVATVLGVREVPGVALPATLAAALRDSALLLVLDNCEHLAADCAALAATLLTGCPEVRILATSRATLRLPGELVWRVPLLTVPAALAAPPNPAALAELAGIAAVRLFLDRAAFARPDFALTTGNAVAVVTICRRLDGLPLALELAASRLPVLSVAQLAARLDDALGVLTGCGRMVSSRQRTLRATLDWSYALLSAEERLLLMRLAVFAGTATLAAAEAACADTLLPTDRVLSAVASLVDQSLVQVEAGREEARYRLLEPVRQYAQARLAATGDGAAARERHAAYYQALAAEAAPALTGPAQGRWLARLEEEHDNLRVALGWLGTRGAAEARLQLVADLWRFWETRGHLSEGRAWTDAALTAGAGTSPAARARALDGAGNLAWRHSDYRAAEAHFSTGLALARQLDARPGIARALGNLGIVAQLRGDLTTARARYEEGVAMQRALGDRWNLALLLNNLGLVAYRQSDHGSADACFVESLALCRELGDTLGIAGALNNLADLAGRRNDYAAAAAHATASLGLFRELGDKRGIASTLNNLSQVARQLGDGATALARAEEALALYRELGYARGVATALHHLGLVADDRGDPCRALALHRESLCLLQTLENAQDSAACLADMARVVAASGRHDLAVRLYGALAAPGDIGTPTPPAAARAARDRALATARARLGEAAFARAWAAGRALTLEGAVVLALAETATPAPAPARPPTD